MSNPAAERLAIALDAWEAQARDAGRDLREALANERLDTAGRLDPWIQHGDPCDSWDGLLCDCGLQAEIER